MVKIKRSGIGEPGTGEPSNCRSIRLGTGASASNVTHDACDSLSGSYCLRSLKPIECNNFED